MTFLDAANAAFELCGAISSSSSIYVLWKDKEVKGVSPWLTTYFIGWGIFNLFFYSSLHQPLSWFAGIVMLLVNVTWFSMAIYYRYYRANGWSTLAL